MESKGMTEWQLFHLAQALTRAKRLEKHREEFHEELYECIVYPSVQLDWLEQSVNAATDAQALKIINMKERYDRKIQREYTRYIRWQDLLSWVSDHDKEILVRYFQKKKHVHYKIINRILTSIESKLNEEERRFEYEQDQEAQAEFKAYMKNKRAFKKVTSSPVKEAKRNYLIDGQFVSLTEEEYAAHQ